MTISPAHQQQLIQAALDVRARAYAPYSHFQVGAAVLGSNLKVYSGCNVENASYGLTICAERSAVLSMVADGCRQLLAVALALPGAEAPCGACRQVLAEFGQHFPVYAVDARTQQLTAQWSIQELIPNAFGPASLGKS